MREERDYRWSTFKYVALARIIAAAVAVLIGVLVFQGLDGFNIFQLKSFLAVVVGAGTWFLFDKLIESMW